MRGRKANDVSGTMLGFGAVAVALLTMGEWMRRAFALRITKERTGFLVAMAVAIALGIGAFVLGTSTGGAVAAVAGILFATIYIVFNALSGQAANTPAVAVGRPILEFQAPTATGEPFDLASMRGKPFLLKFFRGHW